MPAINRLNYFNVKVVSMNGKLWSKNIEIQSNQTKATFKTQNPKDRTITSWNKETQIREQHEPLWKPEVKSVALYAAHGMMSPMSYQGMKRTHANNIMAYRCN